MAMAPESESKDRQEGFVLAAEQCVAKDDVLAAEQRVVIAPTQSRLG